MPDESPSNRERVSKALEMGQEPKDRLWAVVYVLIVIVILVGAVTVFYAELTRKNLDIERELGFDRGSVDCLSVVVDNDRDFDLPMYCRRNEVIVHYPPEVCDSFFSGSNLCGRDWEGG